LKENDPAAEKLFHLSTIIDPAIRSLAVEARRQDAQQHFSAAFLNNLGIILWNRAEKTVSGERILAIIPLAQEGQDEVSGFLLARKINRERFSFMVYRKDRIPLYGCTESPGRLNAFQVLSLVNYFNLELFNKKNFILSDRRLIPARLLPLLPPGFETARLKGILKRPALRQTSLNCFSYEEEVEWWYNPDGDACNCNGDEYYVYSSYESHTYCTNADDPDPVYSDWTGGSGSGGAPVGGFGSGNGYGYIDGGQVSYFSVADEPAEVTDTDPEIDWWNDNTTYFQPQPLPSWNNVFHNYPKDGNGGDMPAAQVYALVGGELLAMYNSNPEKFRNACALRVSRALNYSGVTIPHIPNSTYQGADGKYYFLSTARLYNWMIKSFGTSNALSLSTSDGGTNGSLFQAQLAGNKGIYIMQAASPEQFHALGHATLFDGTSCVGDHCYFNAKGGVQKIILWKLN